MFISSCWPRWSKPFQSQCQPDRSAWTLFCHPHSQGISTHLWTRLGCQNHSTSWQQPKLWIKDQIHMSNISHLYRDGRLKKHLDHLANSFSSEDIPNSKLKTITLTLMTCSLGNRLQSAKVRLSPSRNFLLDVEMVSLELWSISSGRGEFR